MHQASWLRSIQQTYRRLIRARSLPFASITPSQLPQAAGVYLITAIVGGKEEPYYVGRTKNLRRRLYNNHLMGPLANARLKRYLISSGECKDLERAKAFIRAHCHARWIEEPDIRTRGAIEGYVTGVLFPKYGIYEEH